MKESILGGMLNWARMGVGYETVVALPAFSVNPPARARILVRGRPWPVAEGGAGTLALELTGQDGATEIRPLMRMSADGERKVLETPAGSVVVIEEDAAAPNSRRFTYIAEVVRIADEGTDVI